MWAKLFENCIKCGTTERNHRARGLCDKCYDQTYENKLKTYDRTRGIAGKVLTEEYLKEEYVSKKKSLSDIAISCSCSRQFVHKKMLEFKIPTRDSRKARKIAIDKKKLTYRVVDEFGQEKLYPMVSLKIKENFFS